MRNIQVAKNLPYPVPEIIDITDKLPRKKKWEDIPKKWNVKGMWNGKWLEGFRQPEMIKRIIVHHSGPPNGTLESHARFHASKWGAGIAYHIAIDKGRIYQVNDLLNMTYHAGDNNTDSIGIMVNRDLTGSDLTDTERNLLYAAIMTVKGLFNIKQVIGHNECCRTACPVTSMHRIREDLLHLEEQISAVEESTPARAYIVANRINQLGQRLTDPKWGFSAQQKLSWLIERVEGASVASDVVSIVGEQYKNRMYDDVLQLEDIMKEKALL